jgi:hypothetical protein
METSEMEKILEYLLPSDERHSLMRWSLWTTIIFWIIRIIIRIFLGP